MQELYCNWCYCLFCKVLQVCLFPSNIVDMDKAFSLEVPVLFALCFASAVRRIFINVKSV